MNKEEIEKIIRKLKAQIEIIELYLTKEEFQDFCDSTYTLTGYWNSVINNNL